MVDLILPGKGWRLVVTLAGRRGRATVLRLADGREVTAWNCAWGRGWNADWEHLTLNLSPTVAGAQVVTGSASEVAAAVDPVNGRVLHRRVVRNEKGARPEPRPLIFSPA